MKELMELQFLPLKVVTVTCMETSKRHSWPKHSEMNHGERLNMAENLRTKLLDFQGKIEQSREERERKIKLKERRARQVQWQKSAAAVSQ